jgi:hypothetical protein
MKVYEMFKTKDIAKKNTEFFEFLFGFIKKPCLLIASQLIKIMERLKIKQTTLS